MIAFISTSTVWLIILTFVFLLSFMILSTRWLIKLSSNVYNGLDELKNNCLSIKTTEDYNQCWDKFQQLQKKSFHKHHHMGLYEIYGILESKHHDYVNNAANA